MGLISLFGFLQTSLCTPKGQYFKDVLPGSSGVNAAVSPHVITGGSTLVCKDSSCCEMLRAHSFCTLSYHIYRFVIDLTWHSGNQVIYLLINNCEEFIYSSVNHFMGKIHLLDDNRRESLRMNSIVGGIPELCVWRMLHNLLNTVSAQGFVGFFSAIQKKKKGMNFPAVVLQEKKIKEREKPVLTASLMLCFCYTCAAPWGPGGETVWAYFVGFCVVQIQTMYRSIHPSCSPASSLSAVHLDTFCWDCSLQSVQVGFLFVHDEDLTGWIQYVWSQSQMFACKTLFFLFISCDTKRGKAVKEQRGCFPATSFHSHWANNTKKKCWLMFLCSFFCCSSSILGFLTTLQI